MRHLSTTNVTFIATQTVFAFPFATTGVGRFYRPRREYPHPPPKRISTTIMMRMVVVLMIRRPVKVDCPRCSNRSAASAVSLRASLEPWTAKKQLPCLIDG